MPFMGRIRELDLGIELYCTRVRLEEYLGEQNTLQAKSRGCQKQLETVLSRAGFPEDELSQVRAVAPTI